MARDIIHVAVKNALIKDGWDITADPYYIEYEEVVLAADLGAERPIAAERGTEKIVVEVKSFIGRSPMKDLRDAIGQYLIYLGYLEEIAPERTLYLALNDRVFHELFEQKAVQLIIKKYKVSLLTVDIAKQEIVKWTKYLDTES